MKYYVKLTSPIMGLGFMVGTVVSYFEKIIPQSSCLGEGEVTKGLWKPEQTNRQSQKCKEKENHVQFYDICVHPSFPRRRRRHFGSQLFKYKNISFDKKLNSVCVFGLHCVFLGYTGPQ